MRIELNFIMNLEKLIGIFSTFSKKNPIGAGSLIFLCKCLYKLSFLILILIVARLSKKEDFGDFQFSISLINTFTQPFLAIPLIVTKYILSCSKNTQINLNLCSTYFYLKTKNLIFFTTSIITILFILFNFNLISLIKIDFKYTFFFVGVIISLSMILNYFLGFFQANERFDLYALPFFVMGICVIFSCLLFLFSKKIIPIAYSIQTSSFLIALFFSYFLFKKLIFKKDERLFKKLSHLVSAPFIKYSLFLFLSMILFFFIQNMDIFLVKFYFNRSLAGTYARYELFGKIVFTFSASLATVLFSKINKTSLSFYKSKALYLKSNLTLFIFSFLVSLSVFIFKGFLTHILYGTFLSNSILFLLILSAKTLQSFIFLSINCIAMEINYFLLISLLTFASLQLIGIIKFHFDLIHIALVIFVISLIFVAYIIILFKYTFSKSKKS